MRPIKLSDLPPPGKGQKGWPWTEASPDIIPGENILNWPKISIITPSYNQGEFIEETIRSVLLQGYPNLEYIVIDGGSTDNTVEILQKYKPFLKYVSEPDRGQADAINKGLRMATGEIVAYLNSDDVYIQGTFLKIVKIFESRKDIFMVFGDIIHIDKKSKFIEKHETGEINLQKYLMGMFYLPQPTVFFRKNIIDKIGYFDDTLHLAMDYDYWLQIILNFKTFYIHEPLAKARIYHDAKSSSLDYGYLNERLYILNKLSCKYSEIGRDKEKFLGYSFFIGGLTYLRKKMLYEAFKSIINSSRINPYYLVNPHLFWAILEFFIGKKYALRIKPIFKKIYRKNIDDII